MSQDFFWSKGPSRKNSWRLYDYPLRIVFMDTGICFSPKSFSFNLTGKGFRVFRCFCLSERSLTTKTTNCTTGGVKIIFSQKTPPQTADSQFKKQLLNSWKDRVRMKTSSDLWIPMFLLLVSLSTCMNKTWTLSFPTWLFDTPLLQTN